MPASAKSLNSANRRGRWKNWSLVFFGSTLGRQTLGDLAVIRSALRNQMARLLGPGLLLVGCTVGFEARAQAPAQASFQQQQPALPPGMPGGGAYGMPATQGSYVVPQPAISSTQPRTKPPVMQSQLPPGSPPLGLEGYCPVTMVNEKLWERGNPRWGVVHRGRTYLFIGREAQQTFLANPDRFSPVMSGIDPVLAIDQNQIVPGTVGNGVFFDKRFYLFSSGTSQRLFNQNPRRYADEALKGEVTTTR